MNALLSTLLSTIAPRVLDVVDQTITDEDERLRLRAELAKLLTDQSGDLAKASASVVKAEIESEGWLQRNWRPMLMIWFAVLVGAYWFGWTPPNLSEDRTGDLFELVKIGVGGYVAGRSVEKTAKVVAPTLSKREGR